MSSKRVFTRRGTSIAAAALSVALVAPFVSPVAAPQFAAVAGAQEEAPETPWTNIGATSPEQEGEAPVVLPGEINAIYSPATADDIRVVNGNVYLNEGQWGYGVAAGDSTDVAVPGVKVFAQWIDDEGGPNEVTSPVYYAISDVNGEFNIKMKSFRDLQGRERKFDAVPEATNIAGITDSYGVREKVRIWIENPDPEKYVPFWGYGNSLMPKNGYTEDNTGGAGWQRITGAGVNVPGRLQGANQFLVPKVQEEDYPAIHKPQDEWVNNDDRRREDGRGQLSGKVFWENGGGLPTKFSWDDIIEYQADTDKGVGGQKIVASYLTDKALAAIKVYFEENQAKEYSGADALRGDGWNPEYENKLQDWIKDQIKKDPTWIAETVETTTGTNGDYTIQFNGIYGQLPLTPNKVPEDKWDTVAESPNDGDFNQYSARPESLYGTENSKHVNWEWMNVSLVNEDGSFGAPEGVAFTDPWRGGKWSGKAGFPYANSYDSRFELGNNDDWAASLITSASAGTANEWTNVEMGLTLARPILDILEYNATDNFAKPGDKIETATSGVIPVGDRSATYDIVWTAVDPATGDTFELEGAECKGLKPNDAGNLPSCGFTVPQNLPQTTLFTATLYPVSDDGDRAPQLASDEFLAQVAQVPVYEPVETAPGVEVSTDAPTIDNTATPEDEKGAIPEGTVFEIASFPVVDENGNIVKDEEGNDVVAPVVEGATVDPTTGVVTYTPPKEVVVGTDADGNPITEPFEGEVKIPVVAKYPDGTSGQGTAVVTVREESLAEQNTPKYETTEVQVGANKDSNDPLEGSPELKSVEPAKDANWTFTGKTPNGEVNGLAPTLEKVAEVVGDKKYTDIVVDGKVADAYKDLFEPTPDVVITYGDESVDPGEGEELKAPFVLLGKDGKPITDPEGDFDDDGEKNKDDDKPFVPSTSSQVDPKDVAGEVEPGKEATIQAPEYVKQVDGKPTEEAAEAPAGSKYAAKAGDTTKPEWATVNEDGTITLKPGADVEPGDVTFPVVVTYPDGSTDEFTATVTVTDVPSGPVTPDPKDTDGLNPAAPAADELSDPENTEVSFPGVAFPEGESAPEGTKYVAEGLPEGLTIDADTGVVSGTTPEVDADTKYPVTVTVTYPDGSTDTVTYDYTVTDVPDTQEDKDKYEPGYKPAAGEAGVGTKVPQTGDTELPEGTEFEPQAPEGWTVVADPEGEPGDVIVTPPADAENNTTVEIPVVVTYPDGSSETVEITFTVGKDTDGDGVTDEKEKEYGTDPENPDTDGDGLDDGEEIDLGTDPTNPDTDQDGVNDGDEVSGDKNPFKENKFDEEGEPGNTNPGQAEFTPSEIPGEKGTWTPVKGDDGELIGSDTDGDGIKDGDELNTKVDEIGKTVADPDAKDPITDPNSKDTDGDGLTDKEEADLGTDPTKPDTDGDGLTDKEEVDGSKNPIDNDGDGKGDPTNPTNPDTDGDGVDDGEEVVPGEDGKITDPNTPNPSVNTGEKDEVPNDGEGKVIDDKVKNPEGVTGEVVDKDGKPIKDAKVEIDKDGNVTVTIPEGTQPQDAKVIYKDKDGNEIGESDITITNKDADDAGGNDGNNDDAWRKCFADSDYAIWNPVYWLIPAGIITALPMIPGVKEQLDGIAASLNNTVNQIAGDMGIANLLPRVDLPQVPGLKIDADTGRQLLGAAMVIAGLAATGFYFAWCASDEDQKQTFTSSESSRPTDESKIITKDSSSSKKDEK